MIVPYRHLRSILVELLSEADTVKRNLGKDQYPEDQIKSYISVVNGMATHAFTMTSIEKLGINPQYSYGTPLGIYFYPLDQERYEQLIYDDLPFVSDAKQFSLVRIKNPEKWLNLGSSKKYDLVNIYKNLLNKFRPESEPLEKSDIIQSIKKISIEARHWKINSSCRVLDITWWLSNNNSKLWSRILSYLGFEGVYDPGLGVIYEAEPAQLVAFSKNAVENVEMFSTPAVRKNNRKIRRKESFISKLLELLPKNESDIIRDFLRFIKDDNNWEEHGMSHINPYLQKKYKKQNNSDRDDLVFLREIYYSERRIASLYDRREDLFKIFSGENFLNIVKYDIDIDNSELMSSIIQIILKFNKIDVALHAVLNLLKRAKIKEVIYTIIPHIIECMSLARERGYMQDEKIYFDIAKTIAKNNYAIDKYCRITRSFPSEKLPEKYHKYLIAKWIKLKEKK